jgi:hypothetical protein
MSMLAYPGILWLFCENIPALTGANPDVVG